MSDLFFQVPAEVRFGLDVVNRAASIISQFGERVLLVTEAILYEGKIIDRVQGLLERRGIQSIIFDEVVPNATSAVVDEAVTLARGAHAQVVVGLGGLRTLSAAKCVAMVAPLPMEMDDILSGVQPREAPLAFVSIPTTFRDPFLLTDEYLITDSRDRSARIGRTQPGATRAVLVDPKLTVTLPTKYTATLLMDTLLTAFEGALCSRSNFLGDTFFARAVELIGGCVRQAVDQPEDLRARMQASMAGLLCALGLTMGKQGVGASLAYALNARYMVPKSWLACILLPHVMEFHLNSAAEKLARFAALLGVEPGRSTPVEAAARGIEKVRQLIGSMGLPTRLRDFDLNLDDMVEVAGTARSYDMMNYLSRPVSTEDLYELIKVAF